MRRTKLNRLTLKITNAFKDALNSPHMGQQCKNFFKKTFFQFFSNRPLKSVTFISEVDFLTSDARKSISRGFSIARNSLPPKFSMPGWAASQIMIHASQIMIGTTKNFKLSFLAHLHGLFGTPSTFLLITLQILTHKF